MRKPAFFWLFALYLTAAGAFGAWRAGALWSGWPVWCLLLPPVALCGLQSLDWWQRGGPVQVLVFMGPIALVLMGAVGLGTACVTAALVEISLLLRELPPAGRAVIGAAVGAAVGGLTWHYGRSREPPGCSSSTPSDGSVGHAEPAPAPDCGGK
jgi:hypothetical protein